MKEFVLSILNDEVTSRVVRVVGYAIVKGLSPRLTLCVFLFPDAFRVTWIGIPKELE